MASRWGFSWGLAWGDAWGSVTFTRIAAMRFTLAQRDATLSMKQRSAAFTMES